MEKAGFRACKRCQPSAELSPQTELITTIKSYIVEHYKEPLQLQDIAAYAGISPFYLERQFKQVTGETPRTYLEKIRVDKAAHLLDHTKQTNLKICFESGFQSPSNFYKVFKRMMNCSPSEYRHQVRGCPRSL